MRIPRLCQLSLLFVAILFSRGSLAQDYTRWGLPEGAKARLGKGRLTDDFAISPDWERLAVASSIGVWIYDVKTGAEVNLLTEHIDEVCSVAYSPDGYMLASGSRDETIRLWDARTTENLRTLFSNARGRFLSLFARWDDNCQWKSRWDGPSVGRAHGKTSAHSGRSYPPSRRRGIFARRFHACQR
ncbi:MAG: hypothetical protein OXT74_00945 [Candidatus Poribacteria bacterium]|nr:hypothetical protein [Candidatus Poribacteria bacterium]